jgi:hypothetical protein
MDYLRILRDLFGLRAEPLLKYVLLENGVVVFKRHRQPLGRGGPSRNPGNTGRVVRNNP